MKSALVVLVLLTGIVSCQSTHPLPNYVPPSNAIRLGVQVVPVDAIPQRYELRIDGDAILEMITQSAGNAPQAAGLYRGKKIEMRGDFVGGGRILEIDVFYDGQRVASYEFER